MALILAIETSTSSGSVALWSGDKIIGSQYYNIDKSHSSLLHPMIEQLTNNCQVELQQLDAVALSAGPGSYTGLRIGSSAAKGLCYALDIPLISINTLEAMAYQIYSHGNPFLYYCPMIDARRMEVYTLVVNNRFETVRETEPLILDNTSFGDLLDLGTVAFFGDGSDKFKDLATHTNAVFIESITPDAKEMAVLGAKKYIEGQFENVVSYEPFYLKEFRIIPTKKSYAG